MGKGNEAYKQGQELTTDVPVASSNEVQYYIVADLGGKML